MILSEVIEDPSYADAADASARSCLTALYRRQRSARSIWHIHILKIQSSHEPKLMKLSAGGV